ncbi:MAG: hypothetical protein AAFX80_14450 [Cyanobacteria bacterium J06639_18]
MLLGKLGSGRTTCLQRIITECNNGRLQAQRIPLLIKMLSFVDDGRKYSYNFEPNSSQVSSIDLSQIDATPKQIEAARKEIFIFTKSLIVIDRKNRFLLTIKSPIFVHTYPCSFSARDLY